MILKATPEETREMLLLVNEFTKAGVHIIPVPVLDDVDKNKLMGMLLDQMKRLEEMMQEEEDE